MSIKERLIAYPSPHFEERPEGAVIKYLILHYTETDFQKAINYLVYSQAPHRVSSHYLIDIKGEIYGLVDEDKKAWHSGQSSWEADENLNNTSIGIEIVNLGHDVKPLPAYPLSQMESVKDLCLEIIKRYNILPWHVLGHSDIAPTRKRDPGEHFDWQYLASHGVGLWPHNTHAIQSKFYYDYPNVIDYQKALRAYGYDCPETGKWDDMTQKVILAFQRHFSPKHLDGCLYKEDYQKLQTLLKLKQTFKSLT